MDQRGCTVSQTKDAAGLGRARLGMGSARLGMGSVVELEMRVGGLKLRLVVITEREERSEIAAASSVAGLL